LLIGIVFEIVEFRFEISIDIVDELRVH